jgi:hypothetical protein
MRSVDTMTMMVTAARKKPIIVKMASFGRPEVGDLTGAVGIGSAVGAVVRPIGAACPATAQIKRARSRLRYLILIDHALCPAICRKGSWRGG